MQREFHLSGRKKDTYPTKSSINLYYKEDKTTRPSTIALYVLFFAVVLLAAGKLFVFDIMMELEGAKAQLAQNQSYLEKQMEYLADYNEVSSKYSRYTYSYLTEDERICDRIAVLNMLEETVFEKAYIDSFVITGNVVSLSFKGLNLQEAAALASQLQGYEIVEKVEVNTASLSTSSQDKASMETRMVISLVTEGGAK